MSIEVERAMRRRAKALEKMLATQVDWREYSHILQVSEPWDPIRWPENHDWFLIKDVPLRHFPEISVDDISDVESFDERHEHYDRYLEIRKLLENGGEPWPVIVASNGMVLDGFHRLAAMKDLKRKTVDVLYVLV